MNQWIFLIDGYGMKMEKQSQNKMIRSKEKIAPKVSTKKLQPDENIEVFKTFIVKFIGDQEYSFYNVTNSDIANQDNLPLSEDESHKTRNPQSQIHSTDVPDTQGTEVIRLQEQAASLQQSINDSNVTGNEFNRQEAEAKIEIDFLMNDDMLSNK